MFWNPSSLNSNPLSIAVIDENGGKYNFFQLDQAIQTIATQLANHGKRQLGFILMNNSFACIVTYLACLRVGHVPLLLPPSLSDELVASLVNNYNPHWIMREADTQPLTAAASVMAIETQCEFKKLQSTASPSLHPELALLLSTSGSTGSPKLVRISYSAIQANAASIAQYLSLSSDDRAITGLPLYYSYGLSVLNSHLFSAGSIVLTEASVASAMFIELCQKYDITSIAGVPYMYQMMRRVDFLGYNFPFLRMLTQAGGKLNERLLTYYQKIADEKSLEFYVMYGQTEATARISYVPPNKLAQKLGSIGIAIPGGSLRIDQSNNELVYSGSNVMMGYAESHQDLAKEDEMAGVLHTGDLAEKDEDGYFYITGRLKRFIKLAGNRINLDEVENAIEKQLSLPIAVAGEDDKLLIVVESNEKQEILASIQQLLFGYYSVHHSLYRIVFVDSLPLMPSGKKDYVKLSKC